MSRGRPVVAGVPVDEDTYSCYAYVQTDYHVSNEYPSRYYTFIMFPRWFFHNMCIRWIE